MDALLVLALKYIVPFETSSSHQLFTHPANQFWHTEASMLVLSVSYTP